MPLSDSTTVLSAEQLLAGFDESGARALCELAAVICAAPIAGVTLVSPAGEQRTLWHGIATPTIAVDKTPCAEVMRSGRQLVIGDLSEHRRTDGQRWELGGLRAYVGVPIRSQAGRTLGTVCVFDTVARDFSQTQLRGLDTLAAQVAAGIELLRHTREAEQAARARDAAQAAERTAQRRLEAVVEGLGDGIVLLDDRQRLLLANTAFCRMMQLPASASELGADPGALARGIAASPEEAPIEWLSGILGDGEPARAARMREMHLDDGTILEIDCLPIEIEHRRPAHLWQFRDVTARRQADAALNRSEQRFHALLESALVAIFVLDAESKPVVVSDGCAYLFGTYETRYDQTRWIESMHEDDRERALKVWAEATESQSSLDVQYRVRDEEGRFRELVFCIAAMHDDDGTFNGWIGTVADVTEQVETNRELAASRRASEQARADVEARNEELQALARGKDVLLAAISHEFRTPLTSITTFLQMLDAEDGLSEAQEQAVAVIARNTDRLGRLVSDLLSVKETPAELEVATEAVNLQQVAEDAVAAALPRARETGVELAAQPGSAAWAWADPRRMSQVIDSLLDNALKFTPRGGAIVVRTSAIGERTEIEVSDSGVGIISEDLERIFDRFYQGTAGRHSGRGSGLGLAIVRRLLDAQNATIQVRSWEGQGCAMLISVPTVPGA
jgi:PAS domain S-box-containing protein